ncbi:MAG: hypothetical protein RJB26_1409 [Pseudomonadota bacterium]
MTKTIRQPLLPMRRSLPFALLLLATHLAGCATAARAPAMTASATAVASLSAPEALKRNVTIGPVSGGHDTNPMWMSQVGNAEFQTALRNSLDAAGLLANGPEPGRYVLGAELQRLKQPVFGFNMKVTAVVDYHLQERTSGRRVFESEVTTPYTAELGEAFLGVERLQLANEGAIRTNIEHFIRELVESFSGTPTP